MTFTNEELERGIEILCHAGDYVEKWSNIYSESMDYGNGAYEASKILLKAIDSVDEVIDARNDLREMIEGLLAEDLINQPTGGYVN